MKQFNPDSNPTAFRWMREGPIDAVVKHGTGLSWLAFVWIGNMVTENKIREKADQAMEQLQGRYTPAAWVIVCYDRLAALHAAEIWPGEHVLVMTIDGHVERAATPGPCTSPPRGGRRCSAAGQAGARGQLAGQRTQKPTSLPCWRSMAV